MQRHGSPEEGAAGRRGHTCWFLMKACLASAVVRQTWNFGTASPATCGVGDIVALR